MAGGFVMYAKVGMQTVSCANIDAEQQILIHLIYVMPNDLEIHNKKYTMPWI
jgi:hypothetical protein